MRSKLLQTLGANLGLEDVNVVVAPAEPVGHNSDTENTIPAAGTDAAVAQVNAPVPVAGEAATAGAVIEATPGVTNATGDGSVVGAADANTAAAAAATPTAAPTVAAVAAATDATTTVAAPAVVPGANIDATQEAAGAPNAVAATVAPAAAVVPGTEGTVAAVPAVAPVAAPVPATGSSPRVEGEAPEAILEIYGGDDSMEADLIETGAAATAVVNGEEAVEELGEIKAGLESLADGLGIALQDGGLNGQAAQFLHLGIEAYTLRLGMEERMIPSLESFGGTTDKMAATKLSLEAIKDTIREVWEAILRTIKRVRAMLKNFFIRAFGAAPKVRARAEAIKKAAQGATGQAANGEIDAGGAATALMLGSGFPTDLGNTLMTVDRLASDVFGTFHNNMVAACNAFATGLGGAGTDEEKLAGLISNFKPALPGTLGGKGEDQFTHLSDDLPGHKRLAITINSDAARAFSAQIVDAAGNRATATKVKTLAPAEVVKTCDSVIAICNAIEGYQKGWQASESAVNNLTRAGEAFAGKVAAADAAAGGANARKVTNMVAVLTQSVDAAQSKLVSYLLGVSKAALAVGERSVREYDKGAAAANTARVAAPAAATA